MAARYKKGPDGGWGWVIVFASFFVHLITDGILYSSGLFLEQFTEHLQTTKTLANLVITVNVGISLMIGKSGHSRSSKL